ncbi:MAG: tetratricopeptide repeat protein [Candidatus Latescibacteria bacterium]|nr:tetratricopeptide repeat protein [Candidatus Latescibacterota bacterium]
MHKIRKTGWAAILVMLLASAVTAAARDNKDVVSEESGVKYRAGLEHFKKREYTKAIPFFKRAYELDERNIAALFAQGLALNNTGGYAEAAKILKLVLVKEPGHVKALLLYPITLERSGQLNEALAAYDAGIKKKPKDYNFYWGKARVYIRKKDGEKAVAALSKALDLQPDNLKIRSLLAQTYADMGRMDDAAREARKVLEKDANRARARVIVADYLRMAGKYGEAMEEYTLAARTIETKAYAEHYIEVIRQKLEEIEIEEEWEARQKEKTGN